MFGEAFTQQRIPVGGAEINLLTGGDGPPLLLIHGYPQTHAMWHRLALDHPARIERACVMDIAPTLHMFDHTDQAFATGYYHWFFLIQPDGLPEHMIGADPGWFLREKLRR